MSLFSSSSSSSRKSAYNKSDDAGASREERMNRLKFELREHIRFLADYELLSTDWLRMAESLHQIANVAYMETQLAPSEDNPLTQAGKKESGTLWDQERDELAVRILLEEGKLNLVLRILHKFCVESRSEEKFAASIKSVSEKFNSDVTTVTERCRVFEQSVGLLLRLALTHVEALQILDVPEFIQHCAEVLQAAESSTATYTPLDVEKKQSTLVLHYLSSLGSALEDMDEDRVMDLVEQHHLLPALLSHLNKHVAWYKLDALVAACKFLNAALGSEAFQAERARFLTGESTRHLANLKPLFLTEMISPAVGAKKSDVQKLLDEIARAERTPGLAPPSADTLAANGGLKERLERYKAAEASHKSAAAADKAASSSSK